jgi:hypothetical protein
MTMQPDYTYLIEKTGIDRPLMGFYDTPAPDPFEPLIKPDTCLFAYYKKFLNGEAVLLTEEQYGCGGAGKWLCGLETRTLEEYVEFLVDDEGLKADHDLMRQWLGHNKPYQKEHGNLIFSPLKKSEYTYLKTVSFFVNPDQLSMLMIAAQLHASPDDPLPVISPFGSGCMLLVSLFWDLEIPQAIIGATDMAMRRHLPPDTLIFTVTKPMFELLCEIGSGSFLEKSFIEKLKSSRKKPDSSA